MRTIIIVSGIALFIISLIFIVQFLMNLKSFSEFSDYEKGILTGKILLLFLGSGLLYKGLKMKKS